MAFNKIQNIFRDIAGKRANVAPKENSDSEHHARLLLHPITRTTIEMTASRVRVVVFRDDCGVKLPLFDSKLSEHGGEEQASRSLCDMRSSERLENSSSSTNSVPPLSNSSGWAGSSAKNRRAGFIKRPSTDSELLGEMIFGSMPMKTIGNSVKVHYIKSTDQLMLTKMFSPRKKLLHQCSLTDYNESCPLPGDISSQTVERSFNPVPRNHSMLNNMTCSLSPESGHGARTSSLNVPLRPNSALSSNSSPVTPPSPVASMTVSGSVNSSLTRRMRRNRATSLENPSEIYRKVLKPLGKPQPQSSRRKYGLGVILSLSEFSEADIQHFQSFLFSHFTLIDSHLEKLKENVLEAIQNRAVPFGETMTQANSDFLKDFIQLYKAPRIESPVWLTLVGQASRRREICAQFMDEFCSAIVEMETKEKKFFLSSLLTAVLSHHLAWVFTVSRQDSRYSKMIPKSLGLLAESHPYNPLWAQLGDLFGGVSNPLKLTRTIVVGKNATTVQRLLYILTYFIRCSEVEPFKWQETPGSSIKAHQSLKVPISRERSHDSSHDDNWLFESRDSSVGSEQVTPFASPINIGCDTPVVKPHPFSIRSKHTSISSDVDSTGSYGNRSLSALNTQSPSLTIRSPLKTASLISRSSENSQSRNSLIKPHPSVTIAQPTCNEATNQISPVNVHHGNPNNYSHVASCEGMGLCPMPDGFVTFNPKADYSLHPRLATPTEGNSPEHAQCPCQNPHLSTHQLANVRLLGPSHESKLIKNNSTTSMDSGYDRSLTASSTTDYSKDSCLTHSSVFGETSRECSSNQLLINDGLYFNCIHERTCSANTCSVDQPFNKLRFRPENYSCPTKQESPQKGFLVKQSCNPQDTLQVFQETTDQSCTLQDIEHSSLRISNFQDTAGLSSNPQDIMDESSNLQDTTDLPSPTQPLLPTKVTKLVQNNENYSDIIRKSCQYPTDSNTEYEPLSQFESETGAASLTETESVSKKVPLLKVQHPTLIDPEKSLTRQSALLSESDSTPSESFPLPFSPSQSLPLSLVGQLPLQKTRSNSDTPDPMSMLCTQKSDSVSMLSTDSGRGTRSCPIDHDLSQCGISLSSDAYDSELEDAFITHPGKGFLFKDDSLSDDLVDVEKSLSAKTLQLFRQNPSLLQQRLQAHERVLSPEGNLITPEQLSDFEEVPLPNIDDFHLDLPHDCYHDDHDLSRQNLSDFGHSLFVGHSDEYLSDFVLHGTSQPANQFQEKLVKDLTSSVKHSIIDEPIEHGVAIIADTDSWTVKVTSSSKSLQTSDVIVGSANMQPSKYIKQMLSTVNNMYKMKLSPDFCLSHVEDRLLELNERSITLANTLLDYGSDSYFGDIIPLALDTLGVLDHYDRLLLVALAGVNCPDPDIKARLDYIFMTNLLGKQYF